MTQAQRIAAAAAVAIASFGVFIGTTLTSNPSNPAVTACGSTSGVTYSNPGSWTPLDPPTTIDNLGHGGVFNGTGNCYVLDQGISISHNSVTVNGGTYYLPLTSSSWWLANGSTCAGLPQPQELYAPILSLNNLSTGLGSSYQAQNDVVENVNLIGDNTTGAYLNVCAPGLKTGAAINPTLTNVSTYNTWGDGFEFWTTNGFVGGVGEPTTGIVATGLNVSTWGRDAFTCWCESSTFTNITADSTGTATNGSPDGFSFETDIEPWTSGYITVTNYVFENHSLIGGGQTAINAISGVTGPITFTQGNVVGKMNTTPNSGALNSATVTVSNTTWAVPNACTGQSACLEVGGSGTAVTYANDTFSGQGTPTYPLWSATGGANLLFQNCTLVAPFGSNDNASTVSILP